jgi:hypothetical protein
MATPQVSTEPTVSSGAAAAHRESGFMRGVNTHMRNTSEELKHAGPTMFLCECRAPDCYSPIWMSRRIFDELAEVRGGWLLVQGHKPSGTWPSHGPPSPDGAGVSSHGQAEARGGTPLAIPVSRLGAMGLGQWHESGSLPSRLEVTTTSEKTPRPRARRSRSGRTVRASAHGSTMTAWLHARMRRSTAGTFGLADSWERDELAGAGYELNSRPTKAT